MTVKRLGRGLGIALMIVTVVGISSAAAFADGTCYTGCTPPTQTGGGGGGSGGTGGTGGNHAPVTKGSGSGSGSSGSTGSRGSSGAATAQSTRSAGGSLPFTGADVEELTVGGVGALLVGGVLVRRSRQRRRAEVS